MLMPDHSPPRSSRAISSLWVRDAHRRDAYCCKPALPLSTMNWGSRQYGRMTAVGFCSASQRASGRYTTARRRKSSPVATGWRPSLPQRADTLTCPPRLPRLSSGSTPPRYGSRHPAISRLPSRAARCPTSQPDRRAARSGQPATAAAYALPRSVCSLQAAAAP